MADRPRPCQPVFRAFEDCAGNEIWLRRDAVDAIRSVNPIETETAGPLVEVHIRGGHHFWLKGTSEDFGHAFNGTKP